MRLPTWSFVRSSFQACTAIERHILLPVGSLAVLFSNAQFPAAASAICIWLNCVKCRGTECCRTHSSVFCQLLLQVFKGCLLGTDILNHRNIDFWSHQQPAYNLRKFISCAGTNFLIRASAFVEAGMVKVSAADKCAHGPRQALCN